MSGPLPQAAFGGGLCGVGGVILQISVSSGGLPKRAIDSAEAGPQGLTGDAHRNLKYHGGLDRAILLIASEAIDELRGEGWPLFYGALGENLTTKGLNFRNWRTGQVFQAGSATLALTQPRQPCANLSRYGRGIQSRIYDNKVKECDASSIRWGLSGFFAAVLRSGTVQTLDTIKNVEITP